MNVKRWFFNPCKKFQQDISLMASRCLAGSQLSALKRHLAECPECRRRLAEVQEVTEGLTSWRAQQPDFEPSREFQFKLQQAIRSAHKNQNQTETSSPGLIGALLGTARMRWGALAVAWIVIVGLNLNTPDALRQNPQAARSVSAQQTLMTLKALRSESSRANEKDDANETFYNLPSPQSKKGMIPSILNVGHVLES